MSCCILSKAKDSFLPCEASARFQQVNDEHMYTLYPPRSAVTYIDSDLKQSRLPQPHNFTWPFSRPSWWVHAYPNSRAYTHFLYRVCLFPPARTQKVYALTLFQAESSPGMQVLVHKVVPEQTTHTFSCFSLIGKRRLRRTKRVWRCWTGWVH